MSATRYLALAMLIGLASCNKPASSNPVPESAEALLADIEKTLTDLQAYSCRINLQMQVKSQGAANNVTSEYDVRIEKPNRWSIVLKSGVVGGTSVSDGREVITYLPVLRRYTVEPLADHELPPAGPPAAMRLMGPAAFPQAFFGEGLKDLLMASIEESAILGQEVVEGDRCWHARFQQDRMSWDLWATQGDRPLVRRILLTPDIGAAGAGSNDALQGTEMELHVDLDEWDTHSSFTDDDFAFTPPSDAAKSDKLLDTARRHEGPHPLVGEPAPDFRLDRLDGDEFNLADVLTKKVVILDFWATWCGPCIDALPQVAAAAKEVDDDVIFFAVNIGEEADDVRKFLDDKKLGPPVLLDVDGDVSHKYGANAIPQTVLIGLDGRVQVVHVGGSPDMKQTLLRDLRKLIKGEDLAAQTLRQQASESAVDEEPMSETADGDDASAP